MLQCSVLVAASVLLIAGSANAGSVGSYSGCKSLKGERAACEKCIGGGNFYQPGQGCGATEGMHKSVSAGSGPKAPARPKAMPKSGDEYVKITPKPFAIGARSIDANKDSLEIFEGATITLTHPYEMKATEVTLGEWLFVTGAVPPRWEDTCGLECPVTYVTWIEAATYLNALSKKESLEPCYTIKGEAVAWPKGYECTGYRLPTEAEWEFAARGGKEEQAYDDNVDAIAWSYENSNDKTHPVGKKKPNAYGLYDMLGNVWEWTWDEKQYGCYEGNMTDPVIGGLERKELDRVLRGGSYSDRVMSMRATVRSQYLANASGSQYGFRPVRTVK